MDIPLSRSNSNPQSLAVAEPEVVADEAVPVDESFGFLALGGLGAAVVASLLLETYSPLFKIFNKFEIKYFN